MSIQPGKSPVDQAQAQPERVDVSAMHRPIMREQREPRDGYEPVPLWLVAIFGALLFWGGWYLATYSGGFRSDILDEMPEARFAARGPATPTKPEDPLVLGKRLFTANCVSCHQANGRGVPGQYPPLAGSDWVAGNSARVIRIVLHGLEGPVQVNGKTYDGNMPNFGLRLKDSHIAAVLSYVRTQHDWGNQSSPISADQIAAVRAVTHDRIRPWSVAELLKVPDEPEPVSSVSSTLPAAPPIPGH